MSSEQDTMTNDPAITNGSKTATDPLKTFPSRIIGIYGLPGSGKTTLLQQLKVDLEKDEATQQTRFEFIDGSQAIKDLYPELGGQEAMAAFNRLNADEKKTRRSDAISAIKHLCRAKKGHAIIAGHAVLWDDVPKGPEMVWTEADGECYTHMLYLEVDVDTLQRRRLADKFKGRPIATLEHLKNWQQVEKERLREVCYEKGIAFSVVHDGEKVLELIKEFVRRDAAAFEEQAMLQVKQHFCEPSKSKVDTALIIDADKTLSEFDAGKTFCDTINGYDGALDEIFKSKLGYTTAAFYQVMLMFEQTVSAEEWEDVCEKIAAKLKINDEFVDLLQKAAKKENVAVVVATCGIGRVWAKVLKEYGLGDAVAVVGGGRLNDGILVTAEVKKQIIEFFQREKNAFVWAFGDSPLDLPMLEEADQAVVIVCNEEARSKSMDKKLTESITQRGCPLVRCCSPAP